MILEQLIKKHKVCYNLTAFYCKNLCEYILIDLVNYQRAKYTKGNSTCANGNPNIFPDFSLLIKTLLTNKSHSLKGQSLSVDAGT